MTTSTMTVRPLALPRLAAVLLAVLLSLAVVVAPKNRADAFGGAIGPVVLKTALRSAPVAATTITGAACATGVGCLAVGAVAVGLLAYETRDAWLPWASALVNGGSQAGSPVGTGCNIALSSATADALGQVLGSYTYPGACAFQYNVPPSMGLQAKQGVCIRTALTSGSPAGTLVPAWRTPAKNTQEGPANYAGGGSTVILDVINNEAPMCQPGLNLIPYSAVVDVIAAYGTSNEIRVQFPIPAGLFASTTRVECKRPDGTTFTITDTDVGHPERFAAPSCYVRDPTSVPTRITSTDAGGRTLLDTTFPDAMPDYPACFGPSGLLCTITVHVSGVPCAVGQAGCVNWYANTAPTSTSPWKERLSCRFGSYVVPRENCEPLRRSYRPDAPPAGDPITDPAPIPDPNTQPDPDPQPDPQPTPTPSPSPTPSTNPNPTPGPTPGPTPFPTTGPNPGPSTRPDAGVDPDSQSCLGAEWSWNPVSWVYAPVKCAFVWGFVPRKPIRGRIDTIKLTLNGKAPFSWVGALAAIPSAVPGGTCPQWEVKVSGTTKNVICGSSYTNAIRGFRPVLLAFMLSLALWPLVRSLLYGSIPIIHASSGSLK